MQQASTDAASLETVSFVHMEDMTAEDAAIIANHYEAHDSEDTATQVLRLLHELKGPTFGYQIDRFRHSLQCALGHCETASPTRWWWPPSCTT